MAIIFDFQCSECGHEGEEWAKDGSQVLTCPACNKEAFKRVFKSFSILQTDLNDSSRSWGSGQKGDNRRPFTNRKGETAHNSAR